MKKVIVDTSVWIENEKKEIPELTQLLRDRRVLLHWAVLGELSVGNIKNRKSFLSDLKLLDFSQEATPVETLNFIEKHGLHGKGLSLVDCLILASARLSDVLIFSFDKKLNTYR